MSDEYLDDADLAAMGEGRTPFLREVYGPSGGFSTDELKERSKRSAAARTLATDLKLPQRIIDRAASYAADGGTAENAVRRAIVADPDYVPTLDEALRNPAEFVDGMTEEGGANV